MGKSADKSSQNVLSDTGGLSEVESPRRRKGWIDKFSDGQLENIVTRLGDGKWLSDSGEHCISRSQAYHRAETLIEKVISISNYERYRLERRTWPENGGTRWAIRLRKE
jgi:hypothetical protein